MSAPISVRLDPDVRSGLEVQARQRGVGLSTLLRDIAAEAATPARRARIRAASAAVGKRVNSMPEASTFCDFWGTPGADAG